MMTKKTTHKITFWLFIVLLAANLDACSRVDERAFKDLIPSSVISLNSQIQVSIPRMLDISSGTNVSEETKFLDANNLRAGDEIPLEIKNLSNELIVFSEDVALRFFTYDEMKKQWIEIDKVNKEYWPELPPGVKPETYLYPKGPDHPLGLIGLSDKPALEGLSSPERIRILVIGDIYTDDKPSGKQAGAYLDVTIKP
jgi:hypothetical protein